MRVPGNEPCMEVMGDRELLAVLKRGNRDKRLIPTFTREVERRAAPINEWALGYPAIVTGVNTDRLLKPVGWGLLIRPLVGVSVEPIHIPLLRLTLTPASCTGDFGAKQFLYVRFDNSTAT